jgi:hypothetical protein
MENYSGRAELPMSPLKYLRLEISDFDRCKPPFGG